MHFKEKLTTRFILGGIFAFALGFVGHTPGAKANLSDYLKNKKRDWHLSKLNAHSFTKSSVEKSPCTLMAGTEGISKSTLLRELSQKYNIEVHMGRSYRNTTVTEPLDSKDLGVLYHTVKNLPAHFFPLKRKLTILKTLKGGGLEFGAAAKFLYNTIEIFPDYYKFFHSDAERIAALTHEFGHLFAAETGISGLGKGNWGALNEWEPEGPVNYKEFVSRYAASENDEDLAESFTAYRYNGALLKAVAPEKYEFLRSVLFQGIEYLNEASCDASNFFFAKALHDEPLYKPLPPLCNMLGTGVMVGRKKRSELLSCLSQHASLESPELDYRNAPAEFEKRIREIYQQRGFPRFHREITPEMLEALADKMSASSSLKMPRR